MLKSLYTYHFKWFIRDLKDGTVRDPEILSNDEIQVFMKFPN